MNTRAPVSQDAAQLVERLRELAEHFREHPLARIMHREDALFEAADLIEALARPQPSTISVEAVARALAADIMAAMRRARLPKEYADEAHDEFEALTLVPMLLAALPSPEREPMREALEVIAGGHISNGTTMVLEGRWRDFAAALQKVARAALAPPPAQSGDRT